MTIQTILILSLFVFLMSSLAAEASYKRSRSLTSDAEIATIRENITRYPRAKAIADKIIRAADEWLARSDSYVRDFIPASDVPRAFNSSFDGCPVHGKECFKHGNYFWKMDPFGKPWKLVCPIGGEEYPSNDFAAYYKTKDSGLLTGEYADNGWGWGRPGDKHKHWFVAYYCHWLWMNHIVPGINNLGKAYQITGDPKYACKAIAMLDRVADVYPAMDHNKQSRYAAEFAPSYTGKIVNLIWETGLIGSLATAYDDVFDVLAADGTFTPADGTDSPLAGKANADIRRNIEDNLLRVGVQAVYDRKIKGNYGMHQGALLRLVAVLQDDSLTKRACDYVLNNCEGRAETEGFNYALDNLVLREGIAFESAPGYCLSWSSHLADVGVLLDELGVGIFADAKLRNMLTAYLRLRVMDRFTPAIGDSGSVTSTGMDLSAGMARLGLEKFHDPVFARHLLDRGAYGESTIARYGDLRYPVLDRRQLEKASKGAPALSTGSRNLGGYGLGILEAGKDDRKIGVAVYYGPTVGGHAHPDRLFFELYGFGKKLVPDLGYPQFAAEDKDRTAWETHTISHCTVTVNASRQKDVARGVLNQFATSPDVKLLDVSAPDVYPGIQEYRRVVLLIGGDSETPYMVDSFSVDGGHSHDYGLHGFDGKFSTEGIDLTVQNGGTLAGTDVPYGYLYDDVELEKADKTRSFGSYTGSGYSYLYNVERGVPSGTWSAAWTDKDGGIRAIFPEQDVREVVTADGNPPKRQGNPESLKYVLFRNSGDEGLSSRFVSVLQPFAAGDKPLFVERIRTDSGQLLRVEGADGIDYVYLADDPSETVKVGGLSVSGRCVVLRTDKDHHLRSMFVAGGGSIEQGLLSVRSEPDIRGRVTAMDFGRNEITIDATTGDAADGTILFGESNYAIHGVRSKAGRLVVSLGDDTPRVGKLAISDIDPAGKYLSTRTRLHFAGSGCYRNRWLVNEDRTVWHRVENVSGDKVLLAEPADPKTGFADQDGNGQETAYLYDVAPGQEYVIPASCWLGPAEQGRWTLRSNTPAEAALPSGETLSTRR